MIVKNDKELKALQEIGSICAYTLKSLGEAVREGITTKELDELCRAIFEENGAVSAPISCYDFPGYCCISVNDEVAHGIPGDRVLKIGDSVNIDVSAKKNGFFSDTSATFLVLPAKENRYKLLDCCQRCLDKAISVAVAGNPLNKLGLVVQKEAHKSGYTVIKNLCGHGVGRGLHEDPDNIYSYYAKRDKRILVAGMVMAVEPFVSEKEEYVFEEKDGWTLKTPNRSLTAQFEHTIMVTDAEPLILTTCE